MLLRIDSNIVAKEKIYKGVSIDFRYCITLYNIAESAENV